MRWTCWNTSCAYSSISTLPCNIQLALMNGGRTSQHAVITESAAFKEAHADDLSCGIGSS